MKSLKALSFLAFLICCQSKIYAQNCTLACPANIVTKADAGQEGAVVNFPDMKAPAECGTITYSPASGSFFRLGSHSISVTSSTGQKCSFTVLVTDNESPTLSRVTLSRDRLWPASGKLKKVKVFYTASDNGAEVKTAVSVTSNATDGVKDWELEEGNTFRLKASRLSDGSPRIYTITVTATDESGNKTTRTTTIAVSSTMTAKPI